MPEPPQLAPINTKEEWFYSELLLDAQGPRSIRKSEASHCSQKAQKSGFLYRQPCSFGHDPVLMAIGEGRSKDWPED